MGLIPIVIMAFILLLRTNLEDKTLQKELTGYNDYISQVRYHLFVGVW